MTKCPDSVVFERTNKKMKGIINYTTNTKNDSKHYIKARLKFLIPLSLSSNSTQTLHLSITTWYLSSTSYSSQVEVFSVFKIIVL